LVVFPNNPCEFKESIAAAVITEEAPLKKALRFNWSWNCKRLEIFIGIMPITKVLKLFSIYYFI